MLYEEISEEMGIDYCWAYYPFEFFFDKLFFSKGNKKSEIKIKKILSNIIMMIRKYEDQYNINHNTFKYRENTREIEKQLVADIENRWNVKFIKDNDNEVKLVHSQ